MKRILSITFCSLVMAGTSARAQFAEDVLRFSQFNVGVGARSLGMGNVGIGLADDYSSLFRNPAGLALVRDNEFSIGLSQTNYKNDVSFYGSNVQANLNSLNLNNLGLVYPIATVRGSLTFGIGFARIANYSTTASFDGFNPRSSILESLTPNVNVRTMTAADRRDLLDNNIPFQIYLADTAGGTLFPAVIDSVQQKGTTEEGGGINNWSLGGAVDIARNISIGGSVNILSGSYRYDREYNEFDSRNLYTYTRRVYSIDTEAFKRFTYTSSVASDISGFNALFGIMIRKQGLYKIGATVRTPTYYEISENFSDEGESEFDANANGVIDIFRLSSSGSNKYEVRTPPILSVGGSFQVRDWLVIAGDAEYTDWTQMEFTGDNAAYLEENRLIKKIYQPTTNLRGGAEVSLWDIGLQLRGGVVWNPSPYKDDPPEFNQLYYTGGIGFRLDENVFLNTAFAYGKWTTVRDNYYLSGLTNPSRTSEAVKQSNLNVTLSYRF